MIQNYFRRGRERKKMMERTQSCGVMPCYANSFVLLGLFYEVISYFPLERNDAFPVLKKKDQIRSFTTTWLCHRSWLKFCFRLSFKLLRIIINIGYKTRLRHWI